MAKIKTVKYFIEGKEVTINFNCSTRGIFSASVPYSIQEKLNISKKKLEGSELSELEKIVSDAYRAYVDSKTELTLKIGVTYGAAGSYLKNSEGEYLKGMEAYRHPHVIGLYSEFKSLISFDYRVIIEENRNEVTSRYQAKVIPADLDRDVFLKYRKVIGIYMDDGEIHTNKQAEIILPYSESALDNLEKIKNQLQKASEFLNNLISTDNLAELISLPNMKLLN